MKITDVITEAANPAQQAAIAISMKKAGKKPKKGVAESSEEADRIQALWDRLERAEELYGKNDPRTKALADQIRGQRDEFRVIGKQGMAEGSEQDDPYKGTTPLNGKVAARNGHRLVKTYKNPHSPKYHKDTHARWDRDYNHELSRLKSKGVAEGDMYGDEEVSWEKGGRRAPTGAFRNPADSAQKKYSSDTAAMAQGELANKMPRMAATTPRKDGKMGMQEDLSEEFDLIESIVEMIAEHNGVDADVVWADLESLTEDELYVFAVTSDPLMESEAWQKANKRDRTDGMSQKAVNTYRREHPGSKLKTAVTTKPSKLKKGSKASKRRKSYCSRSKGQMNMHNISCAKTPDKAICKARRRWNC
jgi:hypothetical protein